MIDAKKVLRFLEEHFDNIKILYKIDKKDNSITEDDIKIFDNSTVRDNLIEYKIIEKRFNEEYIFNRSYSNFIEYLLDDFSLDMPEQIKKYRNSLLELYEKLKVVKSKNEILITIDSLIEEIFEFEKKLELNISKLIKETKIIKANNEKLDYVKKLQKASELTTLYVKPLNLILEEHNESILYIIDAVSEKANIERFKNGDINIKKSYNRLFNSYTDVKREIFKKNRLLIDEVIPLLDRIQSESRILTGFINFLENNSNYSVPTLLDRQRYNPYSINAHFEVKNIWEDFQKIEEEVLFDDIPSIEESWIYNKEKYYQLFFDSLPHDNFYQWIFKTLLEEFNSVDLKKFLDLSKLIFEDGIEVFYDKDRIDLELGNIIISVPIVNIRSNEE